MTLRALLESEERKQAFYKDCKIVDITPYSENYALVELLVPVPRPVMLYEVLHLDTVVEVREAE